MNKDIKKYLICTFGFSWILWGLAIGLTQLHIAKYGTPLIMIPFVFGGIMPAIIEIALKKKYSSKVEFKSFIKNIINPKHNFAWYIFIIVIAFLSCYLPTQFGGATMKSPLYMAFLELPMMIIGGGLEEIGWRGFLQPALQKHFSNFSSTAILSIIWTTWHIPLFFILGTDQSLDNFVYFTITVIALSFLLAAIYNATQSIFLCLVLHAFINGFWDVYVPNGKVLPACSTLAFGIAVFIIFELLNNRLAFKNKFSN